MVYKTSITDTYIFLHMPIKREKFENETEKEITISKGTNAWKILKFLKENPDKAYTQKEIHQKTEIKRNSLGVVLSRLEDKNLIKHKGKYWTIEADDRLASYEAGKIASSASITDTFTEEDKKE